MGSAQPLKSGIRGHSEDYVADYRRDGYAIVRGLFTGDEIEAIAAATDQLYAEGVAHGRSFRHGNLFYNVAQDGSGEPLVRMVQWPSYHQPVLDLVRLDRRIAGVLAPLIGGDLKQIINQVHWKAPGAAGDFAWHQDSRSRRPPSAFRNLATAYVQTGLAIDPHTPEAGGMKFIAKSHLHGDLGMDCSAKSLGAALEDEALDAVGLSAADSIDLVLDPGDLALWSPFLVHGSGSNRSGHKRRFYINGYVRAEDCDRGEWAFRGGRPVPLGPTPSLVHYRGPSRASRPALCRIAGVKVSGGCHCGAIRFTAALPEPPVPALDCNCSICRRSGFIHVIVPHGQLRLECGEEALTAYKFGTGAAEHLFCRHCGVKSFYQPRSHPEAWSVNARCLDEPVELAIQAFDGAAWEQARARIE